MVLAPKALIIRPPAIVGVGIIVTTHRWIGCYIRPRSGLIKDLIDR